MSSFRITIVELKPAPGVTASVSGSAGVEMTAPVVAPAEVKVFEQVVENVNVPTLIRQINAAPRRRKSAKTAQA